MDVHASREFYEALGIESIPLWPGTKVPLAEEWPTKPAPDQWRAAPDNANIGLRHVGKTLNAEGDNRKVPGTSERILAGLEGLGITNPLIIKSASGIGRHVHLACPDAPSGIAYRNLSPEIGGFAARLSRQDQRSSPL